MNTDKLEIYGSYEKSLNESKTIKGHAGIKYVMGGTARYVTRSNVIDWDMTNKTKFNDQYIQVINQIMNFPEYVTDADVLTKLLTEITKMNLTNFIKLMEKSMNLNEAIMIQLRRLFYVIDAINVKTDVDYVRVAEFCPYEPLVRIRKLLSVMKVHGDFIYYKDIEPLMNELQRLLQEKDVLPTMQPSIVATDFTIMKDTFKLTKLMNKFMEMYSWSYPTFHKLENINIEISKVMEQIIDYLEL